MSRVRQPPLTLQGLPNIILTSILSGIWLAFPLILRIFCLHMRALLAIGPVTICGLATTICIVVRCNTAIRSESVRCALVVFGVIYVRLLATTLSISIHCNITIKPKSICYALMTCGQMSVCYSATTLSHAIHCDIAIRLESVCCVMVVTRLLRFVALASDSGSP